MQRVTCVVGRRREEVESGKQKNEASTAPFPVAEKRDLEESRVDEESRGRRVEKKRDEENGERTQRE